MPRLTIRDARLPERTLWRRFFRLSVALPILPVAFPPRCPHCLGPPTKKVRVTTRRVTGGAAGGGYEATDLSFEVPTCAAIWDPIWPKLAFLVLAVLTGAVGAGALFGWGWPGWAAAGLLAYLAFRAWRAARWVRLVWFDEDRLVFAARNRAWLDDLAALNEGPGREIRGGGFR